MPFSAMITIGFLTRPVAFILAGYMASTWELAVLYTFVFLYLAAAGTGPWAIDKG
jgi:putative oxidoreductase